MKLVIEDCAKTIFFKNRKVRTPVTLDITEKDFKLVKATIKMADIQKWKVINISTKIEETVNSHSFIENVPEEVSIEELDEEPITILEKLMKKGE